MDLSAKMPAQQDSTLPARMEATMKSDAPPTGGDGPMDAPQVEVSRDSTQNDPDWVNTNDDQGPTWECADRKTGSEWEMTDRQETDRGGRPQAKGL